MKYIRFICFLVILLPGAAFSLPHEECGDAKRECTSCHSLSVAEANVILKDVAEVKSVKNSPVPGLFELSVESKGQRGVAYLDFGKKHVIAGTIFDLATKKAMGSQAVSPAKPSTVDVRSIPVENSIVLGNPAGTKRLFVFTDPDCPYCARLHLEVVKLMYMEPDLAIYVKLYPLKMHPQAYDKARVILGRENPLFLLDKAFAGESLPQPGPKDGTKPVDETIKLAESLGITATPTLVLPDGRIVPGFREAADIKKLLSGGK